MPSRPALGDLRPRERISSEETPQDSGGVNDVGLPGTVELIGGFVLHGGARRNCAREHNVNVVDGNHETDGRSAELGRRALLAGFIVHADLTVPESQDTPGDLAVRVFETLRFNGSECFLIERNGKSSVVHG